MLIAGIYVPVIPWQRVIFKALLDPKCKVIKFNEHACRSTEINIFNCFDFEDQGRYYIECGSAAWIFAEANSDKVFGKVVA